MAQEISATKEKKKEPKGLVHIINERCKGCGFCVEYCPFAVLQLSDEFNAKGYHPPTVIDAAACTGCDLCEMVCPDFSIFITKIKKAA